MRQGPGCLIGLQVAILPGRAPLGRVCPNDPRAGATGTNARDLGTQSLQGFGRDLPAHGQGAGPTRGAAAHVEAHEARQAADALQHQPRSATAPDQGEAMSAIPWFKPEAASCSTADGEANCTG